MSAIHDVGALTMLEGRWTLQLLVVLSRGSQRFSDLRSALPGLSANILTARLRNLEDDGLIRRTHLPQNGARAVYELNPAYADLEPLLQALQRWIAEASRSLPAHGGETGVEASGPPQGPHQGGTEMRYFEDIAVGETAKFGAYRVERSEVIAFAERYDPQPFHLSDEAAAKTPFRHLAASGWHTCAMTMAMVVAHKSEWREALLGSPGIDMLRWLAPVYPGDTLRCESVVTEARRSESRPSMGLTKTALTVFNQEDVPVMTYVANMMVRTRP